MAENNRGERMMNIFIHLITHPKQKFSVSQLMTILDISEEDRRNTQRDMQSLINLPGQYVICEGSGTHKIYSTGLSVLDKLALPNFEEVMLQFAFLQRISGVYPVENSCYVCSSHKNEFEKHSRRLLSVCIKHGQDRSSL